MRCPPKPPRPCDCGCGEPIAQKRRGGSPKRFASDACQRRVAEALEAEADEARAYRRLLYPDRRDAHLAYLSANRERYTEHNRAWRARNPTANADACKRWRQNRRRKLVGATDSR